MSLFRYFASRVGAYLLVMFIGLTVIFILPRLMPSDPISNYLMQIQQQSGQSLSPEDVATIRSSLEDLYGIGGSLSSQYVGFLRRVVTLDFGFSITACERAIVTFFGREL